MVSVLTHKYILFPHMEEELRLKIPAESFLHFATNESAS